MLFGNTLFPIYLHKVLFLAAKHVKNLNGLGQFTQLAIFTWLALFVFEITSLQYNSINNPTRIILKLVSLFSDLFTIMKLFAQLTQPSFEYPIVSHNAAKHNICGSDVIDRLSSVRGLNLSSNKRSDASDSSEPVGFYRAPYFNTETQQKCLRLCLDWT